jgi:hypothetical protein
MIQNQSLMMQNMTMMAAATIKQQEREDRKKSMMSKLITQDEILFELLTAESWHDDGKGKSEYTQRIMADKDITVAWRMIERTTMSWPGLISQKQIAKFFKSGFIAANIRECPGGFTVFMFRPSKFPIAVSPKQEFNSMKSLLGDTKLDDDSIKFYAENELFIPTETNHLEVQITMAIRLMRLFTSENSIGLDGFRAVMSGIQRYRQNFDRMFEEDKLFGAKFVYQVDKIFQEFCRSLSDYANEQDPIRSARHRLRDSMEEEVDDLLKDIRKERITQFILPPALSQTSPSSGHTPEPGAPHRGGDDTPRHQDKSAGKGDDMANAPAWWQVNPNPKEAWCIPPGKMYKDFFDTTNPETRENRTGWPRVKHHRYPSSLKPLCIKYQALKRCKKICPMAHIDPAKLGDDAKGKIQQKFQAIYS